MKVFSKGAARGVLASIALGFMSFGCGGDDSTADKGGAVCPSGNGLYCGDGGGQDMDNLYRCDNGIYERVEECAHGCAVAAPGTNDHCAAAGEEGECPSGDGLYCGDASGDDSGNLYRCEAGEYTLAQTCSDGCNQAAPGTDDSCVSAGAPMGGDLTFPFGDAGHVVTDDPDGHGDRTPHRNWDLDCDEGDGVGAMVPGVVITAVDGLPRGQEHGYGNRVCVRSDALGVIVCHNHLQAGSGLPSEGCTVSAGDRIGGCGNSGYVIGEPGTHLDVYMTDLDGNNVEMGSPDTWSGTSGLGDPACGG